MHLYALTSCTFSGGKGVNTHSDKILTVLGVVVLLSGLIYFSSQNVLYLITPFINRLINLRLYKIVSENR